MIKWLKNKYQLAIQTQEYELNSLNLAVNQLTEASAYAKKDEDQGWSVVSSLSSLTGSETLSASNLDDARDQSRKFWRWNPHARAVLNSLSKFVIGRGVTFAPKFELDEESLETYRKEIVKFWNQWVKREKFLRKEKEAVRRLTRDGEFFLRCFESTDGFLRIRFMEPEWVKDPFDYDPSKVRGKVSYGIETSRKDIETVFAYYYYPDGDTEYVRIPANEVIHKKLFADSNRKRGVPFIETLLYDLKSYRDWLKDRVVLNKIRTAIALVREANPTMGTKAQVKAVRDDTQATGTQWTSDKMQMIKPGTVLTTNGFTYKFLSPELDARDTAQDGRNILLAIAAGSGLPEYIITGDASNANYSSSMVAESPGVREFESLQDELRDSFIEIWDRVIQNGMKYGPLKKKGPVPECDLVFPILISRDIQREANAYTGYVAAGVLSKKTVRGKIGVDNVVEVENIQSEREDDLEWQSQIEDELGPEEPEKAPVIDKRKPPQLKARPEKEPKKEPEKEPEDEGEEE